MLAANGLISGTATTNGTYPFTVQASDSSTPPQTVTAQESIQVVDPLKITSAPTWPDACVNKPYSFAVQTSGGAPPHVWTFISNGVWVAINMDPSTGAFSGTADTRGTFLGTLWVNDATGVTASQSVSLTVKQCP
jgi:hypothetical protein